MRSLVQDGKLKVLGGVTTADEIARSTQVDQEAAKAAQSG
jgi:hypothetical protein